MIYICKYLNQYTKKHCYDLIKEKDNNFYESQASYTDIGVMCLEFETFHFLATYKSIEEYINITKTLMGRSVGEVIYSGEELDLNKIKEAIPEEFI